MQNMLNMLNAINMLCALNVYLSMMYQHVKHACIHKCMLHVMYLKMMYLQHVNMHVSSTCHSIIFRCTTNHKFFTLTCFQTHDKVLEWEVEPTRGHGKDASAKVVNGLEEWSTRFLLMGARPDFCWGGVVNGRAQTRARTRFLLLVVVTTV